MSKLKAAVIEVLDFRWAVVEINESVHMTEQDWQRLSTFTGKLLDCPVLLWGRKQDGRRGTIWGPDALVALTATYLKNHSLPWKRYTYRRRSRPTYASRSASYPSRSRYSDYSDSQENQVCHRCGNTGRVECFTCDGRGSYSGRRGHVSCGTCYGKGSVSCRAYRCTAGRRY